MTEPIHSDPPARPASVTAHAELPANETAGEGSVPEQVRIRVEKRRRMLERGVDPYPVNVPRTHTIAQVRAEHGGLAAGEETDVVVGVAGRVMALRNTGKLCFATVADGQGETLQIMLSLKDVGQDSLEDFKADVDLGDHLFAWGRVIASRRGELSVFASQWQIAAKALRPLPNRYERSDGSTVELSDEARVRQRYLDLIVRPEAREMVRVRAGVVRALRDSFHRRGFTEVETPMLQTQHGGATARPFTTHMNAYDIELYLRIAPELFLKRAVVGGVDRVFEINRNFRNEGADSTHSPEFAMVEAYEAYGDYDTMAVLTRELVQEAASEVFDSTTVRLADGSPYELGGQWAELSLFASLSEALGEEITAQTELTRLLAVAKAHELEFDESIALPGKVIEELWEHLVGSRLHAPTFVRDFPLDTSPLTRAHRRVDGVVEKWDLYVRGFELATAYSELIDPIAQRERFEAQALLAARGDVEAMKVDEEFLRAMEHAMPPSGGMGMGIDRLLMAMTGQGVRETILFPLVKPVG